MAYYSGKQMILKPYRTLAPKQKRIFLLYIASWFIPVIFGAVTIFILKKGLLHNSGIKKGAFNH